MGTRARHEGQCIRRPTRTARGSPGADPLAPPGATWADPALYVNM